MVLHPDRLPLAFFCVFIPVYYVSIGVKQVTLTQGQDIVLFLAKLAYLETFAPFSQETIWIFY